MNILLLFFALPIATIILAIVLQKILKSPILVAATFFSIYLIVTFAIFDSNFLVFAIVYTILAFLAAWVVQAICKLLKHCCNNNSNENDEENDEENNNSNNGCCNLHERTINNFTIDSENNADLQNYYRNDSCGLQNFARRNRRYFGVK